MPEVPVPYRARAVDERAVFLHALELGEPARAAYLDEACAGDAALRRRVEALLRSHSEAGLFLQVPALEQTAWVEQCLALLLPALCLPVVAKDPPGMTKQQADEILGELRQIRQLLEKQQQTRSAQPGGPERHFCMPADTISSFQSSTRRSMTPSVAVAST